MSITCRHIDQSRFERLGFVVEYAEDEESAVTEMVDAEANHGHCEEMPTDIPYYGSYGAGDNYGPGHVVCDGKEYEDVPATSDGFVVAWNFTSGRPMLESIQRIRRYLKLERKVNKLFKALREKEPKEHRFSPHTQCCIKCGISANDDLVENRPCIK